MRRLSPGGVLRISDRGWFNGRSVEFRADASGRIERRYFVGNAERAFDPEGRQWLDEMLPRVIRQSGFAAPQRVARILRTDGPAGVLAEISRIESSYGKRVYFTELLKAASLDAAMRARVLTQAGREIDSDFELATLLIDGGDQLVSDDPTRRAYLDAARSIDSDFELHRVLSAALKIGTASPAMLPGLLDTSTAIDSDFEEASLLIEVAKGRQLDEAVRPAFFKAVATIGSDFERHRVLTVVADRPNVTVPTLAAVLEAGASMGFRLRAGGSFETDGGRPHP